MYHQNMKVNEMEVVFELVEVFICVLEAYLMFDFYMAFFPLREKFQRKYIKVAAVIMTAVSVRLVNCLNSSMANIIGMTIIYFSLIVGMFYGTILKKLTCYIASFAIMMGSEFLWIVFMSLPSDFSIGKLENNQTIILFTALGLKVLEFLFFNLVKQIVKPENCKTDSKLFILYSVIPISTMGMMIALAYLNIKFETVRFIQILLIVSTVLVVLGNILIFYIFEKHSSSMDKLCKQEVVITRMELEEKRYEQIESVNQEHSAFLHDINHYMRIIGEMATEKRENDILDLLAELQIKVTAAETEMYCPNRLLNTILNEKNKVAYENGIEMKIKIEPEFVVDQIENMDLIAIMGNLLDNALEAAKKCNHGYVKVYLYTQNNSHFSIIKVINNYVGTIKEKGDRLLSIKEDKEKHGFGIQNVCSLAQKYDGYLQNFYEEGVFTAIVVLPNLRNM